MSVARQRASAVTQFVGISSRPVKAGRLDARPPWPSPLHRRFSLEAGVSNLPLLLATVMISAVCPAIPRSCRQPGHVDAD